MERSRIYSRQADQAKLWHRIRKSGGPVICAAAGELAIVRLAWEILAQLVPASGSKLVRANKFAHHIRANSYQFLKSRSTDNGNWSVSAASFTWRRLELKREKKL